MNLFKEQAIKDTNTFASNKKQLSTNGHLE